MAINKELTIEIVEGEIQISIGLATLAFATENGAPDFPIDSWKVDPGEDSLYSEFGKSVLRRLLDEEEEGTTLVHTLFDDIVLEALERGDLGFIDLNE